MPLKISVRLQYFHFQCISCSLIPFYLFVWLSQPQKLAVGSLPERIITAFQTVVEEHHNEDDALCTCTDVATHVGKIKEEAENATPGNVSFASLALLNNTRSHSCFFGLISAFC